MIVGDFMRCGESFIVCLVNNVCVLFWCEFVDIGFDFNNCGFLVMVCGLGSVCV